jgi:hypothetical protein
MNYYNKKIFIALGAILLGYYGSVSWYGYYFDATPPIVRCEGMTPGECYSGNVQLKIHAQDEYKIKNLSIFIDEKTLLDNYTVNAHDLIYPFVIPTMHLHNGTHTLKIICNDASKNKNETILEIPFLIDNDPLEIILVSPSDMKVIQGNTLHIQVKSNKIIKKGILRALDYVVPMVLESKNSHIYEGFIPISTEEITGKYVAQIIIEDIVNNQSTLEIEYTIIPGNFKKQFIKLKNGEEKHHNDITGNDFQSIFEDIPRTSPSKKLWQGTFYKPCLQSTISTEFGVIRTSFEKGRYRHDGVDFAAAPKSPVWACQDGIVIIKGFDRSGYGNLVVLDHGVGLISLYAHLNNFGDIEVGQTIKKGTIVGYVGMTGYATGYHLHWEMRLQNVKINPLQWVGDDI